MLRFRLPTIGTGLAFLVIHFSDRFLLNRFAGLEEVGVYAVAYKFAFPITYLVGEPFGRAWNVSFYAHVAEPDWRERFGRVARYFAFFLVAFFLVAFFLVLAATAIALFIHEAIFVLTEERLHPAASLVPVLVLSYVLRELGDFYKNLLNVLNRLSAEFFIAARWIWGGLLVGLFLALVWFCGHFSNSERERIRGELLLLREEFFGAKPA